MIDVWFDWNWINVVLIFVNFYVAIYAFKNGNNFGGHLNMAACLVNGLLVALKLTA